MKEGCQTPKIIKAGQRLIELLGYKHILPFQEKGRMTQSTAVGPDGGAKSHRVLFPSLET